MSYHTPHIILASKSFGRRQVLEGAGLKFTAIPAQIDERAIEERLHQIDAGNEDIALELAKEKALAVSKDSPDALIIGSDQILDCEGQALHKAANKKEALEKLQFLRGKTHSLISSVCLAHKGEILWSAIDTAHLTMHNLDDEVLLDYMEKAGEALTGCVGAYALESYGSWLFEKIEGNYFTILGLPLLPLLTELRSNQGVKI